MVIYLDYSPGASITLLQDYRSQNLLKIALYDYVLPLLSVTNGLLTLKGMGTIIIIPDNS